MLRRLCCQECLRTHVLGSTAAFSTSQMLRSDPDPVEREREKELRQQVLQKYKGMQVPEMTDFQYGHFSTGGIQAAAAQQAMQSQDFPSFFGGGANNTQSNGANGTASCGADAGNRSGGNSGCGAGSNNGMPGGMPPFGTSRVFRVDWLMLFTGVALMYLSGKIIYNQMTRGVADLDFPLWTASIEVQAKHLIFCVQFDEKTREELKRDFQTVRRTNPFADFFEWVRSRCPEFCCGNRHSPEMAVGAVTGSLTSNNSRELIAFATSVRQSLGRRGGDPLSRLDEFVDKLQVSAPLMSAMRGGMTGAGFGSVPPYTPSSNTPAYSPPVAEPQHTLGMPLAAADGSHGSNPFEHFDAAQKLTSASL